MGVHGETPPPPPLIKSFQDCRKQAFKPVAVAFVTAASATFAVASLLARRLPQLRSTAPIVAIGVGMCVVYTTSQSEIRKCMQLQGFLQAAKLPDALTVEKDLSEK
eukprot:m.41753 g.41753  ORF g.41753 m.41753 type:complete len:106 (+) comp46247_c0_seq4:204-521(+)